MSIKFYLYLLVIPLTIWTMLSLNIEQYFKKGHINQIKIFYILVSFSISYLVVNFLYEIYQIT
jgi:uncharacterized integral membrane protein (TIGR02327 family)